MNILYLAHPASIHDLKWMQFTSSDPDHHCICMVRSGDKNSINESHLNVLKENSIEFAGYISDFSIARPWQTLKGFILLRRMIKTYRIDLFHILYAEPNALWVWGKNWLRVPVIITTRGSDILITIRNTFQSGTILNSIVKKIYKAAFLKTDYITCTSQLQMDTITHLIGRKEKMELIRTGIDIEKIIVSDKSSLPDKLKGRKYIFFPRNMRPLYNHELAIDSIKLLPREIKNNYSFIFLDEDSDDQNYVSFIKEKMREVLNSDFIFLPRQDQKTVFELYKRSSLVVMTPDSDGSPVSAMEAMVCGSPVILPEMNYDTDLFNPGTIFFFPEYTPSSLANQINFVINNPDRVKLITDNAKKKIIEKGDRVKEMTKLYNIYQELL